MGFNSAFKGLTEQVKCHIFRCLMNSLEKSFSSGCWMFHSCRYAPTFQRI